jgi:uncharacterized protein involved in exopolysaccharide biosynthesis
MKNNYNDGYRIVQDDQIDLKTLWIVLWTNKKLILKIIGSFVSLMTVYLFFASPLYYSYSTIYNVESKSPINSLSALASVTSIDLGPNKQSTTVDLVDYVTSRRLKNLIIEQKWPTTKNEIDLITYWEINDTTGFIYSIKILIKSLMSSGKRNQELAKLRWTFKAMNKLNERIIAKYNNTGLLKVELWMEDPVLAQSIAGYVVNSIVHYTNSVKADSWKRTREFYIQRLGEVKIELEKAENTLITFQKENRRIIDSPDLIVELANLKRDVEIKTALFITLQNEYEFARIEETKDLTGIKILDKATYPIGINKPKKKILFLLSILVGCIVSIPAFLTIRAFNNQT